MIEILARLCCLIAAIVIYLSGTDPNNLFLGAISGVLIAIALMA